MDPQERQRAGTWALGALAWLFGLLAASVYLERFPLDVVVQAGIERMPGAIATEAIELLGHLAIPLAFVGLGVATVVGAAILGVVTVRGDLDTPGPWTGALVGAALTLGLLLAGPAYRFMTLVFALTIAVLPVVALAWFVGRRVPIPPPERRAFLQRVGIVGVGSLAAGALGVVIDAILPGQTGADRSREALDRKRTTGRTLPGTTPSGGPGEFDFGKMPRRVGHIDDHYIVDKNATNPRIDAEDWTLDVRGEVESPYTLSFDDLLSHDALVDEVVTMVCISNRVGGQLISTAEWTGIPLVALLERADVAADAFDIVTHAADGYSESLPVEVARREDILIAVGASGATLPRANGFPARLLIPGRYGMKSTKWVSEIEVSTRDHKGFWTERGWEEAAIVNTLSYIRAVQARGDRGLIGGVAYAGLRGIDRVEVSVDDGTTWVDATLEAAPSPYAWRRWRAEFDAAGRDTVEAVVRATDGTGERQTAQYSEPHPGGSTGWHRLTTSL